MEDSNCPVSLPSLLCNENEDCVCLDETREEEQEARFYSIDCKGLSETEDEYIQTLVARERTYSSGRHGYATYDCLTDDWLQCAYLDAVQWVLKVGFPCFVSEIPQFWMILFNGFHFELNFNVSFSFSDEGHFWVQVSNSLSCCYLPLSISSALSSRCK